MSKQSVLAISVCLAFSMLSACGEEKSEDAYVEAVSEKSVSRENASGHSSKSPKAASSNLSKRALEIGGIKIHPDDVKDIVKTERDYWLLTSPKKRSFDEVTKRILEVDDPEAYLHFIILGIVDAKRLTRLTDWAMKQKVEWDLGSTLENLSLGPTSEQMKLEFLRALYHAAFSALKRQSDADEEEEPDFALLFARRLLRSSNPMVQEAGAPLFRGSQDDEAIGRLMHIIDWDNSAAVTCLEVLATCKSIRYLDEYERRREEGASKEELEDYLDQWEDHDRITDYLFFVAQARVPRSQKKALLLLSERDIGKTPDSILKLHTHSDKSVAALAKQLFPK